MFGFTFLSLVVFFFFFLALSSYYRREPFVWCCPSPFISLFSWLILISVDTTIWRPLQTSHFLNMFNRLTCLVCARLFPGAPAAQHIGLSAWVGEKKVISFRPCREPLHRPVDAFLVLTPNTWFASSALLAAHTEHARVLFAAGKWSLGGKSWWVVSEKARQHLCLQSPTPYAARKWEVFVLYKQITWEGTIKINK